jgi:hypothetical protein
VTSLTEDDAVGISDFPKETFTVFQPCYPCTFKEVGTTIVQTRPDQKGEQHTEILSKSTHLFTRSMKGRTWASSPLKVSIKRQQAREGTSFDSRVALQKEQSGVRCRCIRRTWNAATRASEKNYGLTRTFPCHAHAHALKHSHSFTPHPLSYLIHYCLPHFCSFFFF